MAKKPSAAKSNKLFSFLGSMIQRVEPEPTNRKTTLDTDRETSLSSSERNELMKRMMETAPHQIRGTDPTRRYIGPLSKKIAQLKLDNEAMSILAPEIKLAENIVIPSIISPTDMRDGEITLISTSSLLDDDTNARISEVLDKHFNKYLKLSTKLPAWIREALYGAGSKPLLVLPITELDIIMNDPDAIISKTTRPGYSTESLQSALQRFNTIDSFELPSIFGLADNRTSVARVTKESNNIAFETYRPLIESSIIQHLNDVQAVPKKADGSYNLGEVMKKTGEKLLKDFISHAIEGIKIADNPDTLKIDKVKKAKAKADITQKIEVQYKTKTIIIVNQEVNPSRGNPVVYELPPEAVIPIFTPGTPTDHIGYFICIDEFGNPIHVSDEAHAKDLGTGSNITPSTLYDAFGLNTQYSFNQNHGKRERDTLMSDIYQKIVESHIKGRLKDSGFDNIYLGASESIYRCMFARYLSARKTKLLFVPKDFVTYFCFRHNQDGTGRSQIEDIRFVLSLKITLLICRMMASMNSAMNRKKINIDFDEGMGDPIQYIELLVKEAIDKSMVNFSYDPNQITRNLAERALTVNAKNVPGAEAFDISTEPNEYQNIKPDESLFSDIENMMVLGLDLPPSAANILNDNEFMRSVATNNLFFSRRIQSKQKVVCEKIAHHVQIYTHLSQTLKDEIRAILKQGHTDKKDKSKDSGTKDISDEQTSLDATLIDVIKHINATLPTSEIAPNKTEFEELDAMIGSITTALEGVFDNDLASDDPIAAIRSIIKSDIIRDYMQRMGVSKDTFVPDINAEFMKRVIEYRHQLANLAKGISDIKSMTTASDPNLSSGFGDTGGDNLDTQSSTDTPPDDGSGF